MKHLSCAQHSVKVGNLVKILHKMHSWWAHSLKKAFTFSPTVYPQSQHLQINDHAV